MGDKKTEQVAIRMTPSMRVKLESIAEREGRSLSGLMHHLILKGLNQSQDDPERTAQGQS